MVSRPTIPQALAPPTKPPTIEQMRQMRQPPKPQPIDQEFQARYQEELKEYESQLAKQQADTQAIRQALEKKQADLELMQKQYREYTQIKSGRFITLHLSREAGLQKTITELQKTLEKSQQGFLIAPVEAISYAQSIGDITQRESLRAEQYAESLRSYREDRKIPTPILQQQFESYRRAGFSESEAVVLAQEGERLQQSFTKERAEQILRRQQQPSFDIFKQQDVFLTPSMLEQRQQQLQELGVSIDPFAPMPEPPTTYQRYETRASEFLMGLPPVKYIYEKAEPFGTFVGEKAPSLIFGFPKSEWEKEFQAGVTTEFIRDPIEKPIKTIALFGVGYGVGKVAPPVFSLLSKTKIGAFTGGLVKYGVPSAYGITKGFEIAEAPTPRARGEIIGGALSTEIIPLYAGALFSQYDKLLLEKFVNQQKILLKDIKATAGKKTKTKTKQEVVYRRKFSDKSDIEIVKEIVRGIETKYKTGGKVGVQNELLRISNQLKSEGARQNFAKILDYLFSKGLISSSVYSVHTGKLQFGLQDVVTTPQVSAEAEVSSVFAGKGLYERYQPSELIYGGAKPPAITPTPDTTLGGSIFSGLAVTGKIDPLISGKTEKLEDLGKIAPLGVQVTRFDTVQPSASAGSLLTGQALTQPERLKQPERERLAQPTALGLMTGQTFKQPQLQKEVPRYKYPQPTILREPTRGVPKKPIPKVPVPIIFGLWFPGEKFRREERTGYHAFAKSKGKYQKITTKPMTMEGAKDVGARIVDNTLSAQFKIESIKQTKVVKGKQQLVLKRFREEELGKGDGYSRSTASKFRDFMIRRGKKVQLNNRWIEKRGKRSDTLGEQQGLTVAAFMSRERKRRVGLPVRKKKSKRGTKRFFRL